jgi:hypothetical protein
VLDDLRFVGIEHWLAEVLTGKLGLSLCEGLLVVDVELGLPVTIILLEKISMFEQIALANGSQLKIRHSISLIIIGLYVNVY